VDPTQPNPWVNATRGRLWCQWKQVDGGDDDECDGGRGAGGVAAPVAVRQRVDVVQQVDEAQQHRALRPHQRVVHERVEQHENQSATDQHALAADRPEHAVLAVLERALQRLDDRLGLGSERRRGRRGLVGREGAAAAPVAAEAEPAPADEKRQRQQEGQEELGEPDEAVLEEARADEQSCAERDDASCRVRGDRVLPRLIE